MMGSYTLKSHTGESTLFIIENNKKHVSQLVFIRYVCSGQSENLDNSGIALPQVRITKLADIVRILPLCSTLLELSVHKVRIRTK